ncbi:protein SPIRAL1-like 2 [Silene latifolia]|uniref:protein SPIRAL1-like 2 n=1 Tax=Silene latifolia TaxID=37657 RepID=UPI003D76A776
MGRRGVSYGGGKSSLDYLFGGGEASTPPKSSTEAPKSAQVVNNDASPKPTSAPSGTATHSGNKNIAAGIHGNTGNNYLRTNGQNCGNFITERPSTKVHAAPGGGSSLGYLFGGSSN